MSAVLLFYLALGLQGGILLADEIVFHRRRGLPLWERWGHPLDTLVFTAALAVLWVWGPGPLSVSFAVVSCLVVTKDEWVHASVCGPGEQWLHAVLFLLHPVVLALAHFSWGRWSPGVLALPFAFFFFQLFYWNFHADRTVPSRPRNRQ